MSIDHKPVYIFSNANSTNMRLVETLRHYTWQIYQTWSNSRNYTRKVSFKLCNY